MSTMGRFLTVELDNSLRHTVHAIQVTRQTSGGLDTTHKSILDWHHGEDEDLMKWKALFGEVSE
jgi:hypothetical protein